MSQGTRDPKWRRRQNIPSDITSGDGAMLNNHEFIWISSRSGDDYMVEKKKKKKKKKKKVLPLYMKKKTTKKKKKTVKKLKKNQAKIQKYNAHKNEWEQFIDFPKNSIISSHNTVCNQQTQKIFVFGGCHDITASLDGMFVFDLTTKQWSLYKENEAINPCLVNLNGAIHRIGGHGNSQHLKWCDDNKFFENIHHFKKFREIRGTQAIYVASKNMMVLIGGIEQSQASKGMGVWTFCLETNQWQKRKEIIFYFDYHSAVLSSNEEYIVVAGGYDVGQSYKNVDTIHILDIRDNHKFILRKCSIKCPMAGRHKIFRVGGGSKDLFLIHGFVKNLFKLPPLDILELIQIFYYQESIHWLQISCPKDRKKDNNHFAIDLKHILSSLL